MNEPITAISLFASSGIGDLALREAGVDVIVASELVNQRAQLFRTNFPSCEMIDGDIGLKFDEIVAATKKKLKNRKLDIIFATPPCQGMSKNGRGKLLQGNPAGKRTLTDPRNQLSLFVPKMAEIFKPKVIVFENVPEMRTILVESENGEMVNLLTLLGDLMGNYIWTTKVIEFADYGVPQRRQRLISVFVRKDVAKRIGVTSSDGLLAIAYPEPTHANKPTDSKKPWVSVLDELKGLPKIDAGSVKTARSKVDFHYVPVLSKEKYWWVSNTPSGASAFDNQCVNPKCKSVSNPVHGSTMRRGINRSNSTTPVYCVDCGDLLPRPSVEEGGERRLMKGFTSAYKRMRGDLPSSALTRNLSYACSDQKIHPTQNRVLSLLEAMRLHTITEFNWRWELTDGTRASDKLIRDTIGESIPPKGLLVVFSHLKEVFLSPTITKN